MTPQEKADIVKAVAKAMGIDPERVRAWTDKAGHLRVDLRMPEGTEYAFTDEQGVLVPRLPEEFERFVELVEDVTKDGDQQVLVSSSTGR